MGFAIAGEKVGGLAIGGEKVGGFAIGSDKVWPVRLAAPVVSVTAGSSSGVGAFRDIGAWWPVLASWRGTAWNGTYVVEVQEQGETTWTDAIGSSTVGTRGSLSHRAQFSPRRPFIPAGSNGFRIFNFTARPRVTQRVRVAASNGTERIGAWGVSAYVTSR